MNLRTSSNFRFHFEIDQAKLDTPRCDLRSMASYLSFVKKKEKEEADISTRRRNHSLDILDYPALIAIYYYNFT